MMELYFIVVLFFLSIGSLLSARVEFNQCHCVYVVKQQTMVWGGSETEGREDVQ
jgi:hypothetical protein